MVYAQPDSLGQPGLKRTVPLSQQCSWSGALLALWSYNLFLCGGEICRGRAFD
ncbi:hypothetical protein [Spirosoma koreense]